MNIIELNAYQEQYQKLIEKIHNSNVQQIVYTVPPFVVANTAYNLKKCVIFLIKKLRDQNYNIEYQPPNYLIVSDLSSKKINHVVKTQQNESKIIKNDNNKITDCAILNIINKNK